MNDTKKPNAKFPGKGNLAFLIFSIALGLLALSCTPPGAGAGDSDPNYTPSDQLVTESAPTVLGEGVAITAYTGEADIASALKNSNSQLRQWISAALQQHNLSSNQYFTAGNHQQGAIVIQISSSTPQQLKISTTLLAGQVFFNSPNTGGKLEDITRTNLFVDQSGSKKTASKYSVDAEKNRLTLLDADGTKLVFLEIRPNDPKLYVSGVQGVLIPLSSDNDINPEN